MSTSTAAANAKFVRANLLEAVKLYPVKAPTPIYSKLTANTTYTTRQQYEEAAMASGLPLPGIYNENQPIASHQMRQVGTKTFTPFKRAMQVRMSREWFNDDNYGLAKSAGTQMANVFRVSDEIDGAFYLISCIDSAKLLMWDGKTYAATDHPTDTGTYSNRFTTPENLSIAALELAVQNMMAIPAHMGYITPVVGPFMLEHGPANHMLAERLLTTQRGRPESADNDRNVVTGTVTDHVTIPYLASTVPNYWSIHSVSPMENKRFLLDREALTVTDTVYDGDNDSYKITGVRRKVFGVFDARDTYFSPVT